MDDRYTKFGANAVFDGCPNLPQDISLEVDGKDVEIPQKLEGLIVVNLPSYAAGLNMWTGDIPHGILSLLSFVPIKIQFPKVHEDRA